MKFLKRSKKIILIIIVLVVILFAVCGIYLADYYHTDMAAVASFVPAQAAEMKVLVDNTIIVEPKNARAGFIFYPGGKVEYTAYQPLMEALAAEGVLCALVEMPFNLAVLDVDAADGICAQYPEVTEWYIGGHSLGGSMAASYLAKHSEEFAGLILLGSYSTTDLSAMDLKVLSIYGSEDKIVDPEIYADNKANLPADFMEFVIEGGCHAGFGMYGSQVGDGVPTISSPEQIEITAEEIVKFIGQ